MIEGSIWNIYFRIMVRHMLVGPMTVDEIHYTPGYVTQKKWIKYRPLKYNMGGVEEAPVKQ